MLCSELIVLHTAFLTKMELISLLLSLPSSMESVPAATKINVMQQEILDFTPKVSASILVATANHRRDPFSNGFHQTERRAYKQ